MVIIYGKMMRRLFHAAVISTLLLVSNIAAQKVMTNDNRLFISRIEADFPVSELDSDKWNSAKEVEIGKYWSGKKAPDGRHFKARLLWSDTALYMRFEAVQNEPLVVSENPVLTSKTNGLWDRDVCEVFIAPDAKKRNKYYEFEIAPTGEWIDLGIEVLPKKRNTDMEYKSGMESAARIGEKKVVMAIKVPWTALGKTPKAGDIWLGNLLRCVGKDPGRGYLAWQPTLTKKPNFHVPEKFGEFEFTR